MFEKMRGVAALWPLLGGCGAPSAVVDGGAADVAHVADQAAALEPDGGSAVVRLPQRTPAVPLAVRDPALSVWSFADLPTDDWPRSWSGAARPLAAAARVDGSSFRLLGLAPDAPPMALTRLEIRPSRTSYRYLAGGVEVTLSFITPIVPRDDEAMALPGVWVELGAVAVDGKPHAVDLYLDAESAWARGDAAGALTWRLADLDSASGPLKRFAVRAAPGTERVYTEVEEWPEWGELTFAAPVDAALTWQAGNPDAVRARFVARGALTGEVDATYRSAAAGAEAFAFADHAGSVDGSGFARRLFLGHARSEVVRVDGMDCVSDWTLRGDLATVVARALDEAPAWRRMIEAHDDKLLADAETAGGATYAGLIALAYRQAWGGNRPCRLGGEPLVFQEEIASGSLVSTADVIFPTSPLFLDENPKVLRRMLAGFFEHLERRPTGNAYPPHDLGAWPTVGSDPGFADTPVETAGDLLILVSALALRAGDVSLAREHQALLTGWAEYLIGEGVDPQRLQLSTDDFTGELAHTAYFGLKIALAVEAWSRTETLIGAARAQSDDGAARALFADWLARARAGDHLGLTLDGQGWSIKYNLFIDRLLGLGLVPKDVLAQEVAWYRQHGSNYGTPLDSRFSFTKADWLSWAASLSDDPRDFEALIQPIAVMLANTTERAAFPDIWDVETGQLPWNFTARPVVGALFGKLLLSR